MKNKNNTVDYGPLEPLLGIWHGAKGVDISPERVGEEVNHFREEVFFEGVGQLSNAEEQSLVALFYHQRVIRISDNKMIHNESGYYSWDAENKIIMKSFSIPRGIAVNAGGSLLVTEKCLKIDVGANIDDQRWSIAQSPFMKINAQTKSYHFNLELENDVLTYYQKIELDIFGRSFEHTEQNNLTKIQTAL